MLSLYFTAKYIHMFQKVLFKFIYISAFANWLDCAIFTTVKQSWSINYAVDSSSATVVQFDFSRQIWLVGISNMTISSTVETALNVVSRVKVWNDILQLDQVLAITLTQGFLACTVFFQAFKATLKRIRKSIWAIGPALFITVQPSTFITLMKLWHGTTTSKQSILY